MFIEIPIDLIQDAVKYLNTKYDEYTITLRKSHPKIDIIYENKLMFLSKNTCQEESEDYDEEKYLKVFSNIYKNI